MQYLKLFDIIYDIYRGCFNSQHNYLRLSKVMQSIFKVLNIIVHVHKPSKEGFSSSLKSKRSLNLNLTMYISDPRCKTNINECESSPCQYGGTCVDGIARYECVCIPGITGPNCETDIDECQSMPCQNGGMCIDHINGQA